jgi:hypothetical protein
LHKLLNKFRLLWSAFSPQLAPFPDLGISLLKSSATQQVIEAIRQMLLDVRR